LLPVFVGVKMWFVFATWSHIAEYSCMTFGFRGTMSEVCVGGKPLPAVLLGHSYVRRLRKFMTVDGSGLVWFVWFNVRQHNNGYIDVSFWELF
jgi:hypothetical protein